MTLEEQVVILTIENNKLREENRMLRDIIIKFETRIAELEELLRKANLSKNSSNSSKPPSTDIASPQRNQSLREPSGKKPGGQPGHKGTTLQMTDNPDEIIELSPNFCNKCGCPLENEEVHLEARRQEVDIPPIKAIVKEYRLNSKTCPKCGHHQESEFPAHISNNIQYGSNVESIIAYLWAYQYVPYQRLKELLSHIFNLELSEGTINNILRRMSIKAQPFYDKIKEILLQSYQAGSDESGVKVNGKKFWAWVWQTISATYITISDSRGVKAIEHVFPEGLKKAILNTDRWAAQLQTPAAGHQMCISHILRDLNYIEQVDIIDWAKRLKVILKQGIELKRQQLEYSRGNPLAMQLERDLDKLLQENIPKELYKDTCKLQKSLIKNRSSILTFLYYKDVPADNNGSERAIRNVKVKQKVSGQFKTGEDIFCILRSIIDTCKKRYVDIMFAMNSIAQL